MNLLFFLLSRHVVLKLDFMKTGLFVELFVAKVVKVPK